MGPKQRDGSTARMQCCVCGETTENADGDDYVELALTFPLNAEHSRQWLGAHRECVAAALAPGFEVYGPMPDPPSPQRRPRIIPITEYDRSRGVVAEVEGGQVTVESSGFGVAIVGDDKGLRDLARWLLALSHPEVAEGERVVLVQDDVPLVARSLPLDLVKAAPSDFAVSPGRPRRDVSDGEG